MSPILTPLRHIPLTLLHGIALEGLLFTQSAKKMQTQFRWGACISHRLITTNGLSSSFSWRAGEDWALCFCYFLSFCWKEKLQLTKWLKIQHPLLQSSHSGRGHLFQRWWTGSVLPFSCLLGIHKGLGSFLLQGSQHLPGRKKNRFWRDLF